MKDLNKPMDAEERRAEVCERTKKAIDEMLKIRVEYQNGMSMYEMMAMDMCVISFITSANMIGCFGASDYR